MNGDFLLRGLDWVRTRQSVHTHVLPQDAVADSDGIARVDGFLVRGTAARTWGVAGLWAMLFGSILVLANLPGFTRAIKAATERSGYWVLGAGAICFVIAEIMRRRQRTRVVVELRPTSAGPVTPESLAALTKGAGRANAWIIAEAGFEPQAIVAARARAVCCFESKGEAFGEVDTGAVLHEQPAPPEPSTVGMTPASRAST